MRFTNKTSDDRVVYGALVKAGEQTPDLTAEQALGLASQDIWEAATPVKTTPAAPVTEENK